MKTLIHQRLASCIAGAFMLALLLTSLLDLPSAEAGLVQWRNRVPASEANPNNIGSYVNTIETGNGGTTGYDNGLDVDLDTSLVPNDKFFVAYLDHNPQKVEYEFTQHLNPGESYTAQLSFQGDGDFYFTPNTIEFLSSEGDFSYDLKVDWNGSGLFDVLRSGDVTNGEIAPWDQFVFSGEDHRNLNIVEKPNGWYYGELTITNNSPDADFDNDLLVDGSDFLTWQRGLGTPSATHAQGDANGDGTVDALDLAVWQNQYGQPVAPLASLDALAVPEPSTLALVALGTLGLVSKRLPVDGAIGQLQ